MQEVVLGLAVLIYAAPVASNSVSSELCTQTQGPDASVPQSCIATVPDGDTSELLQSQVKVQKVLNKQTPQYELMPSFTATCPAGYEVASQQECQNAYDSIKTAAGLFSVQGVAWMNADGIPLDCSVNMNGFEQRPHWNTRASTSNARVENGEFRIICKIGSCLWAEHEDVESPGYAGDVDLDFSENEAKARCVDLGSEICKAVTCKTDWNPSAGFPRHCTVRASTSLVTPAGMSGFYLGMINMVTKVPTGGCFPAVTYPKVISPGWCGKGYLAGRSVRSLQHCQDFCHDTAGCQYASYQIRGDGFCMVYDNRCLTEPPKTSIKKAPEYDTWFVGLPFPQCLFGQGIVSITSSRNVNLRWQGTSVSMDARNDSYAEWTFENATNGKVFIHTRDPGTGGGDNYLRARSNRVVDLKATSNPGSHELWTVEAKSPTSFCIKSRLSGHHGQHEYLTDNHGQVEVGPCDAAREWTIRKSDGTPLACYQGV